MEERVIQIIEQNEPKDLILFGKRDELYEIIASKIHSISKTYQYVDDVSKLKMYNDEGFIILVWNPNDLDLLQSEQKNIFNILNEI